MIYVTENWKDRRDKKLEQTWKPLTTLYNVNPPGKRGLIPLWLLKEDQDAARVEKDKTILRLISLWSLWLSHSRLHMMTRGRKVEENHGTYRKPPVEHLVLEDVGEGGGVPGQQVRVPRRGELPWRHQGGRGKPCNIKIIIIIQQCRLNIWRYIGWVDKYLYLSIQSILWLYLNATLILRQKDQKQKDRKTIDRRWWIGLRRHPDDLLWSMI